MTQIYSTENLEL